MTIKYLIKFNKVFNSILLISNYLDVFLQTLSISVSWLFTNYNLTVSYKIGQAIDSLNNVKVYYNGGVENVSGRILTKDHYNLGLQYQCVEFVKRYYYQQLKHKMPVSNGNAIDYFNKRLNDGELNLQRNLIQFKNPGNSKPAIDDIIVFSGNTFNKFGHVAIISNVADDKIEIIQQNPGRFGRSRKKFSVFKKANVWKVDNKYVLGWLRKSKNK